LSAVIESLDELKHGSGFPGNINMLKIVDGRGLPSEFSMSSVRARIAARGGEI
jgi:hypothetical protein